MIGVGLIGYGLGGAAFHAPLVQAEPGLRLHAVVTSRAEQVGRELPGVRVVGSAEELLEDPAVELVVVAAPNAVHHELAAAALLVTTACSRSPGSAWTSGAWNADPPSPYPISPTPMASSRIGA